MEKKQHGNVGKHRSLETKKLLSIINTGKKKSPESVFKQKQTWEEKRKNGYVRPGKGKPAWNRGVPHKKETIEKQKATIKANREAGKYKSRKGIPSPLKGITRSEEFKEKLRKVIKTPAWNKKNSEAQLGPKNHRYGVVISDECRKKISEYTKGKKNGMYGKNHSPESKEKQSLAAIKRLQRNNNKRGQLTVPEKLVKDMFETNDIEYNTQFSLFHPHTHKYKSYDFFLPNQHLLVEIDGVYWHGKGVNVEDLQGIQKLNRGNDLLKNKLALDSGYRLLRIWEDELDKLENLINNNFTGLEYMEINDSSKDTYFENLVYLQ